LLITKYVFEIYPNKNLMTIIKNITYFALI